MFERLFGRYCEYRRLPLSEKPGSRTLCGERSASGFNHESDAVIAFPGFMTHIELKYLNEELDKNHLLIFNQKGLDFLAASKLSVRRRPFYRLLVSGRLLSQEARKFALQWGIITVEPDRLPLLLIHRLASSCLLSQTPRVIKLQNQLLKEVPYLISPLQKRLHRLASLLGSDEPILSNQRIDRALNLYQLNLGDAYWTTMDETEPTWLEERYHALQIAS
jgi:hypothetical protein